MHARGIYHLVVVTAAWFGWNVQWGALLAVVLPGQLAAIAGPEHKELVNGFVGPLGAAVSLVLTPLAGAMSDRSTSRFGRRRPFMLAGALVNYASLAAMRGFGPGDSVVAFAGCVVVMQVGSNLMGGPYAGLIPDLVPPGKIGLASGVQALMSTLGLMTGAVASGQLARHGDFRAVYTFVIAAGALSLLPTLLFARETPQRTAPPKKRFRPPSPREHPRFYWVLATRAMVGMGVYGVLPFFQYFLADVVRVADPVKETGALLGVIIGCGVPATLVAGALSDRVGRKPVVYLSGGLMALASAIFIPDAYFPSMAFTFGLAAVFGVGNGAYEAVNWALAIDALPNKDDAAKDLGIWHVALVLPQVMAPSIAGVALSGLKGTSLPLAYTVVFAMTAAWFTAGTLAARKVGAVG